MLPFDDDSAGIIDLSHLNHKPAGVHGPLQINSEGHFVLNGERQRFIGVNITQGSAYPSAANAEKVARRLAKFGVNLVRFHHIDNGFGAPSLIDYSGGNSRNLNAANLDKLDYFIAQLKANGIYTNLNLLNSRYFYPGDGLPASISQLAWKESHVLGFVDPRVRALEKEYAQQLINHRNPYTGLTYAEDPAIAFVEINNENGLFQQYFDGAMDAWPADFRSLLDARWNTWLRARYPDSAAAEAAWGAIDEPLGAEKLTNADFSNGITGWTLEQHGGAQVTSQTGNFAGRAGLRLQVTTAGSADWHVQLNQSGQTVVKDQLYTLSFWARSPDNANLAVSLQQAYDPWGTLESRNLALTDSWQYVETQLVANVTDNNLRINFNGFGNRLGQVFLAGISFRPGGSLGALPPGQSLEAGNVASNVRSQGYTQGRNRDWADFLRSVEAEYWTDMYDAIKTGLGYSGLVTGTAIMNTPPSTQKALDFADAHAYWEHPQFPGADWDPVNWVVQNRSMVNHFNNTLSGMAKQRIAGIPFTVSEYQHSSPNTYGSEGPLLIAAYGALQDWDAIIFFAYDAMANDNWNARYFNDFFSMNAHPTKMANLAVAANLYRRGHVSPAQQAVVMNFDPDTELDVLATRGAAWNIANGAHLAVPDTLVLVNRLALDVSPEPQGLAVPPAAPSGNLVVSDTQQLRWDLTRSNRGLVSVDTPQTKAVIGFGDGRVVELGNVRISVGTTLQNWATVALSLQEGSFAQPQAGARGFLVTTGQAENTAMQWKDSTRTSVGTQWGRAPTLVEVIPAVIDLPFSADRTRVWVLDESGQRRESLAVTDNGGQARITLTLAAASLWYEVEVDPLP